MLSTCGISPAILVPGLHLAIAQVELVRQLLSLLHAEILLPLERLLQRLQLMVGEGGARLALLFAQSAHVAGGTALDAVAVIVFGT